MRILMTMVLCLLAVSATADTELLDRAAQRELLTATADLVQREYIFEDIAATTADTLRSLAGGDGTAASRTPGEFVTWLSGHLLRLTGDKHVRARLANPAADSPDSAFGIRAVDVLDDGIGYLRIDRFYRADECRAHYDAAMARLADCRAVVVDLAGNGGGSDANMLLASYFMAERTLMNRIEWRQGEPMDFEAGPSTVPALATVPLYILIDGKTFSAAEAVAYALQQRGRAVIVGEPSRGGANPNRFFPLGHGLEVSVSIGRTVNPVSGTNWEGVGVQPDVVVPGGEALTKALELLRRP
ncbi:MAG: S41 family peptidase [bacterium]|nr:S41 family peptidase [bacterium]